MVVIRNAGLQDIDTIAKMAVDFENYLISLDDSLMDTPLSFERYREVLIQGFEDEKHMMFIAEENGVILGFADCWIYPEFLHGGLSGYLHNIYIDPKWRSRGIGASLVDKIRRDTVAKGAVLCMFRSGQQTKEQYDSTKRSVSISS